MEPDPYLAPMDPVQDPGGPKTKDQAQDPQQWFEPNWIRFNKTGYF